jgi:hypothetical protein
MSIDELGGCLYVCTPRDIIFEKRSQSRTAARLDKADGCQFRVEIFIEICEPPERLFTCNMPSNAGGKEVFDPYLGGFGLSLTDAAETDGMPTAV